MAFGGQILRPATAWSGEGSGLSLSSELSYNFYNLSDCR